MIYSSLGTNLSLSQFGSIYFLSIGTNRQSRHSQLRNDAFLFFFFFNFFICSINTKIILKVYGNYIKELGNLINLPVIKVKFNLIYLLNLIDSHFFYPYSYPRSKKIKKRNEYKQNYNIII